VSGRFIHTRFGADQVRHLLQTIFSAELVRPSTCLWIISPWISDIPVIDNRGNGFRTLGGDWERTEIRLSGVIGRLLEQGTTVHLAARPDDHNRGFLDRLQGTAPDVDRLHTHLTETLHEKGILGDGYYLSGSMNITYNGISFNQEMLHFITDTETVASHRQLFTEWWGGVED
jgi:hypothetical protein